MLRGVRQVRPAGGVFRVRSLLQPVLRGRVHGAPQQGTRVHTPRDHLRWEGRQEEKEGKEEEREASVPCGECREDRGEVVRVAIYAVVTRRLAPIRLRVLGLGYTSHKRRI